MVIILRTFLRIVLFLRLFSSDDHKDEGGTIKTSDASIDSDTNLSSIYAYLKSQKYPPNSSKIAFETGIN